MPYFCGGDSLRRGAISSVCTLTLTLYIYCKNKWYPVLLLTLLVSVLQATFFRATPCQAGSLEKNHLVFVGTKTYIPDALLVAKPETLKK